MPPTTPAKPASPAPSAKVMAKMRWVLTPEAEIVAVGADDRDHVAGAAGDGHLGEGDHPAIARQEHEGKRDHAEEEDLGADLHRPEGARRQRIEDERGPGHEMPRLEAEAQNQRGGGAAGERGHAGRPNMPWGRIASTATMMRKV